MMCDWLRGKTGDLAQATSGTDIPRRSAKYGELPKKLVTLVKRYNDGVYLTAASFLEDATVCM